MKETLDYSKKSTVREIQTRFDNDVERFSNLQTGQSATIDAPLVLELIAHAAAAVVPNATDLLDVGCGAGNYSLKLLERLPNLNVTLVDLSRPMLDRAALRIDAVGTGRTTIEQADIRELALGKETFDVIVAAAVLHHLRGEDQWKAVFEKFYAALRPNGCIWISDLILHTTPPINAMMWSRYGDYLTNLKDVAYRDTVFAYIEKEDTPRPLMFQIDMLRKVGFSEVEILHKNSNFAAFGAIKR
jgi:tRNA (cmo5U34)-methyltransferase